MMTLGFKKTYFNAWMFLALLFITATCLFVPLLPVMPTDGHDPSWVLGMNHALAQGLNFGRDIIFTFGPYASIFTHAYHPTSDALMIWASLYLAIFFAIATYLNFKESKWYVKILLLITLAGIINSSDALLFFYPLLVGAYLFKSNTITIRSNLLLIALFLPFGLLPLIKGSLLVPCLGIIILSTLLLLLNKHWISAALTCITPIISALVFWMVSGQPLNALPAYFISMQPIIDGYTEAMSVRGGHIREIFLYLIATIVLLSAIIQDIKINFLKKVILFFMFLLILFVAFKAGFVRHDAHALHAAAMLLLTGLLITTVCNNNRHTFFAVLIAMTLGLAIVSSYQPINIIHIRNKLVFTYQSSWDALKFRIKNQEKLTHEFNNKIAMLHKKVDFPKFDGTTDIYSYDQSYLISSKNTWNPRPVFQSYSVYTPELIKQNKAHLLKNNAPDHLIFKVQPIDNRIPSLEDGASWPVIISHYEPINFKNNYLFLKKRATRSNYSESLLSKKTVRFNQVVVLPESNQPIFVKLKIEQSRLGKIVDILFKTTPLEIVVNLKNGSTRKYRIISGMTETGFLLSPIVENTTEFGLLYADSKYLTDKTVQSFLVHPEHGRRLWNNQYEVEFITMDIPKKSDVISLYKISEPKLKEPNFNLTKAKACDGRINTINYNTPAPIAFRATALLNINGWLAKPNAFLILSNQNNQTYIIKTTQKTAKYATTADISKLKGWYVLRLAYLENSTLNICPEFNIMTELNGEIT
ncbi:MAG: hypothetical protein QNK11_09395 [Legionella sp.]|nr:hypothetical protein [Legionella sp.]